MRTLNVDHETIEQFLPLTDPQHAEYYKQFKTFYGGRGGRKSWEIARGLLIRGMRKRENILCTREFQNSIEDSVLSVLEEQAQLIGCADFYLFQKRKIYGRNRTEFSFKGLGKNVRSIKSTEGITLVWNEEAQDMSQFSMDKLYPTVLRNEGCEIWNSFNPINIDDPVFVRHVTQHDPANSYLAKVNYTDNPDITQAFIEEAERLRKEDYDAYAHIYLGECWSRSDAQILNEKWIVEEFEAFDDFNGPYFGADWGFSVDPTALVKLWIGPHMLYGENCLYVEYEAYGYKTELDDIKHLFAKVPASKKNIIRADSARPETISFVKRDGGYNIIGAEKWTGSVEDGISFLRSFDKIIIHPRCKNYIQECRKYSYKIDKLTGDVLPVIISKFDHGIDATRYALQPAIKARVAGMTARQMKNVERAIKTTLAPKQDEKTW